MLKASIINALRKATDTAIRLNPTTIELVPHTRTNLGGGVWKMEAQDPRDPQEFSIDAVGSTLSGITGTTGGVTNAEGVQAHSWSYNITGRWNSEMAINDTWQEGDTVYRIIALQPENGYEKVGVVTALGRDPSYG